MSFDNGHPIKGYIISLFVLRDLGKKARSKADHRESNTFPIWNPMCCFTHRQNILVTNAYLHLYPVLLGLDTLVRYLDEVSRDEVNNWTNQEAEACKHLPNVGFID